MKMKNVVAFDLDGVLLDSETDISWILISIDKTLDHFNIDKTEEHKKYLYFKNAEQFKKISYKLGLNPTTLWPIRNKIYIQEKLQAMKDGVITPFPDVNALYKLIEHYELAIISNSPQCVVDAFIQDFKFHDLFTYPIGRGNELSDIEQMKPHPSLFNRLKHQTKAKEFMFIGDRESDRIFADATGMKYIHLNRTNSDEQNFKTLHEIVQYILENC